MKLIFAQGNPGTQYATSRHNVGWQVLDAFAAQQGVSFSSRPKFNADIAEFSVEDEKILLAKPATYYNETGISARAIIDFYKLDPRVDILVLHDELALDFGTIRVREKGSDAGNNGIKSLNTHIGPDYHRLRIGIAAERQGAQDDADFVLSHFNKEEQGALESTIIPKGLEIIAHFIAGSHEITSHKL